MTKHKAFLINYKFEMVAFIVNILVAIITFSVTTAFFALVISVGIFTLSTFVVIYYKTKDKDFYFIPLDSHDSGKEWVGRGVFKYVINENCFEITNSDAGFIFPKVLTWDDYTVEFDFKISNKALGFVVRAVDLSNYIMMQCSYDGINPHIRQDGQWIVFSHTGTGLSFASPLNIDLWHHAKLVCEKRSVRVAIYKNNNNAIFDRHWIIPENITVEYKENLEAEKTIKLSKAVDFDFGAMGFRDYGHERAFIKNVFIEKLF